MRVVTLETAQTQLRTVIDSLNPGDQIVILDHETPVANLTAINGSRGTPVPGRGIGLLTILADDDECVEDRGDQHRVGEVSADGWDHRK